jgi:hypothetical protein
MDVNQLEDEYTPSLFSKRFENREDLFAHYNKFSSEGERKTEFEGLSREIFPELT